MSQSEKVGEASMAGLANSVPHERTTLAWERTAISIMVVGIALARFAATNDLFALSAIGVAQTALGGVLLFWTGAQIADIGRPGLASAVGVLTVMSTCASFVLVAVVVVAGQL